MPYKIDFHPIAEVEFWEAVDWYDEQKENLGKDFARVFEHLIATIAYAPFQFPIEYGTKRRAVMQKFPYIIFFEVYAESILILSVFHTKREPRSV